MFSSTSSCPANGILANSTLVIRGRLGLSGIPDDVLDLHEGNVGGGGSVTLVIGNDLNVVFLPDTDAAVGRPHVDANRFSSNCGVHG